MQQKPGATLYRSITQLSCVTLCISQTNGALKRNPLHTDALHVGIFFQELCTLYVNLFLNKLYFTDKSKKTVLVHAEKQFQNYFIKTIVWFVYFLKNPLYMYIYYNIIGERILRDKDCPLLERINLGPDEVSGAKLLLRDRVERKQSLLDTPIFEVSPAEEEVSKGQEDFVKLPDEVS